MLYGGIVTAGYGLFWEKYCQPIWGLDCPATKILYAIIH
jgi:hypothetical protein